MNLAEDFENFRSKYPKTIVIGGPVLPQGLQEVNLQEIRNNKFLIFD